MPILSDRATNEAEPSLARRTARFALSLRSETFPAEIREKVGLCLLDYLSCCIGALKMPWAPALMRYLESRPSRPESFQWGLANAISAGDAAFGNGVLGHGLIREDMHVASGNHIGVMVLPAMLALAEREHLAGRDLLAGIVAAYEVTARLGMANRAGVRNRHFRPSGISGAFGVTGGAIAALGLDEMTAVNALAFAANSACGLNEWAWSGGQDIYVHAGMAARNGINALDLARSGLVSSERILEGADGMFAAYGSAEQGAAHLRNSFTAERHLLGVRHKPYAGCNFIQTPVGAALVARQSGGFTVDEIEHVTIDTFSSARSYPGCDYVGPFSSVQQSKMSLQFAVAAAVVRGRVTEEEFASLNDADIVAVANKTSIALPPEFADAYPARQPAAVKISLRTGRVLDGRLDDVAWLARDGVLARFRTEAAPVFDKTFVAEIEEMAFSIDALDDASEFAGVLKQATLSCSS